MQQICSLPWCNYTCALFHLVPSGVLVGSCNRYFLFDSSRWLPRNNSQPKFGWQLDICMSKKPMVSTEHRCLVSCFLYPLGFGTIHVVYCLHCFKVWLQLQRIGVGKELWFGNLESQHQYLYLNYSCSQFCVQSVVKLQREADILRLAGHQQKVCRIKPKPNTELYHHHHHHQFQSLLIITYQSFISIHHLILSCHFPSSGLSEVPWFNQLDPIGASSKASSLLPLTRSKLQKPCFSL